ncbi:hypothetical protein Tco_0985754 [Tanacetum coccineum]
MTYTILNMFNLVEVSKLNMTVGHPNNIKAIVTHVGSLKLIDQIVIHDVLVVSRYEDPSGDWLSHPSDQVLNILKTKLDFEKDKTDNVYDVCHKAGSKSSEPNDDGRDIRTKRSNGIDNTSLGGTKNIESTRRDDSNPNDSTSEEVVSDVDDSAILEEKNSESKGDGSFNQKLNEIFQTPNVILASQSGFNPIRSSRKTSMPKKLSDFKLDTKLKHSIDKRSIILI